MECKIIFVLNTYFVWIELFFYEPEEKHNNYEHFSFVKKITGMRFIVVGFEPNLVFAYSLELKKNCQQYNSLIQLSVRT